ncbi:MAG: hypothetical protein KBS83_05945, partial [Lachnospiraceae bacterium]|nr:hypothetical protein [Candidatus Equihabitans merdae]
MSDREDRQLARRRAARREKQKIQRLKRRRRRVLSGLVCVLILLITIPYMLIAVIRGRIVIHPEGTETVVQTPVDNIDKPDGTGVVAASSWTYTTDEVMPSGDIVNATGAFYTYDTVRRDLYFLQKRYSDIMRVEVFGHSLDNRELLD